MGLPGPDERAAQWQDIRNARPIPPRRLQRIDRCPILVTARVVWALDGPEDIETSALDWVGTDVLIELQDGRWQVHGVWLDARDVARR